MEHFHEHDHVSTWRADMMRAHLSTDHGVTPPMSWEVGRLHRFHLEHHQTATECGAYYGVGDGTAATCRRPKNHPEISQDGIGHSPQPIPIQTQTKAEEAPMTDVAPEQDALSGEEQVEQLAKTGLAIHEPGTSWDDLGQESRDHWRDRARVNLAAATEARARIDAADRRRTDQKQEGEQVITRDRVIATMAGISFDTVWARDENGSLRGAMRSAYGDQAGRVVAWLERGGAMVMPEYASLGEDLEREQALARDLEETNNGLRSQLRGLTEERDNLDRLLQAALGEKDRLFEQMDIDQREHGKSLDAVQRGLATARAEEDRLRGQLAIVINERDATRDARSEAEEARDRAQQALMAKLTEAGELRQVLETGRARLRMLVTSLKDSGWEGSTVYGRLVWVLGEQAGDAPVTVDTDEDDAEKEQAQLDALQHGYLMDDVSAAAESESESDLLWAKRFAAGEI